MAEHDEIYGEERRERLLALLRELGDRIRALDAAGELLARAPELMRLLGDVRTELFHYEVRSTYDSPEVAESRRIVDDARRGGTFDSETEEDDEPWRPREE